MRGPGANQRLANGKWRFWRHELHSDRLLHTVKIEAALQERLPSVANAQNPGKGWVSQEEIPMKRRSVLAGLGATAAAGVLGMPSILRAQSPITLNGAVQFNDDHAFTKALVRFEELV